jgi:hypothetical protein
VVGVEGAELDGDALFLSKKKSKKKALGQQKKKEKLTCYQSYSFLQREVREI